MYVRNNWWLVMKRSNEKDNSQSGEYTRNRLIVLFLFNSIYIEILVLPKN